MDRIMGLEYGADDYVVKPFNPLELILRAEAILKRLQGIAKHRIGKRWRAGRSRLQLMIIISRQILAMCSALICRKQLMVYNDKIVLS
jgi:DNA-binding response OmpR family regulator